MAIGAKVAVPDFGTQRPEDVTDFNDMAALFGLEAVSRTIRQATTPDQAANDGWPDPLPLTTRIDPEPYPEDALTPRIYEAVKEVQGFVKAPLPLIVSSALSALSLACQGHIDVKRADLLQGPTSLNLLVIAGSGERKDTCDDLFMGEVRRYQDEQSRDLAPEVERYQAKEDAWKAEREGLLLAIKNTRNGKNKGGNASQLKADLEALQAEKPKPPREPQILLVDETPESLAWKLVHRYPAAGVVSSEAGLIFGANGMGKDSIVRSLSLLNTLWSGKGFSIGRRTTGSFTVRGVRLTVSLQVQMEILQDFIEKSGLLARGGGFWARFLLAWPESTQGQRTFSDSPKHRPSLAAFNRRIAEILQTSLEIHDDGSLSPAVMTLTPAAKQAFITYHNEIEGRLGEGGELFDVRDVASKTADNAARLAALLQWFEDPQDTIEGEYFERASRIAAWHLSESQRFFGELALPQDLADAVRLDTWIVNHCRQQGTQKASSTMLRQYGPVRDKKRFKEALESLTGRERLRDINEGRQRNIYVNPALLGTAS